jgi:hypothetical protein
MAPGTNIGAAHPIYSTGGTVSEKIVNDAAAYARSIAAAHKRNTEWPERAVRESVSATAEEALSLGVIDLTASDLPDLLTKLNGRTVHRAGGDATLAISGAQTTTIEMDAREKLLAALTEPTVAYLFLLLGLLAIVVEISAPHGFVTGTLGFVAVVLALVGLVNLPVQISGAALLVLGMVLLGLELKITSHGALTLLGLAAFVFGSILLLPRIPGYRISPFARRGRASVGIHAELRRAARPALAASAAADRGRTRRGPHGGCEDGPRAAGRRAREWRGLGRGGGCAAHRAGRANHGRLGRRFDVARSQDFLREKREWISLRWSWFSSCSSSSRSCFSSRI